MDLPRIGKGTYGQVYMKNVNTVVKECEKYEKTNMFGNKSFELSTITEISVLSIDGLKHTPNIQDYQTTLNDKILISMNNGGRTLLDYSKTIDMTERIKLLPKFAFQLIEASLYLQENGIIHNDIKSANVLVNNKNDLTLIDFGLCAFETINKPNSNFQSIGTTMSNDFGTYTICPPETFVYNYWSVEKYMSWSIGVTLCEFLFKSHSVIYDCVLNSVERALYNEYYKNDWTIKQLLGQIFMNKLKSGVKTLIDLTSYFDISTEMDTLMNSMLSLNMKDRSSLKDLYNMKIFDSYRNNKNEQYIGLIPALHCNIIDKCLSHSYDTSQYKHIRSKVINHIFDIYIHFNKLNLFLHAVHIFDKYCSVKQIAVGELYLLGMACVYVAQYIEKPCIISLQTLIETLSWVTKQSVTQNHLTKMIEDVVFHCSYSMYSQTVDVQISKTGEIVDMLLILDIMRNTLPPYNNNILVKKYVAEFQARKL
jgi:serine/threonine protein kinase